MDGMLLAETRARLGQLYPVDPRTLSIAPVGAGGSLNQVLSRLVFQIDLPAVADTMALLRQANSQEERLHYLLVLRHAREGWTHEDRRTYFAALGDLERTVLGGEGMPGFLSRIRREAVESLSETEQRQLGELLLPGHDVPSQALVIQRPFVKQWGLGDIEQVLLQGGTAGDRTRGERLYAEALCVHCHRIGLRGQAVGPDLTSVPSRFGRRDILASILAPSNVVAEKYRGVNVVTSDGRVITGLVIEGGDYRAATLRIATDPLRPLEYQEIAKKDIEQHQWSNVSPMPEGLLNTFTASEILDLLQYIESAGSQGS
jgi:putative heme-binding domain-containing protein